MRGIDRSLGGLFLDTEMWKLAHAGGRLSLRLGEALAPMLQKKGYSALGYSSPGDYCREELGISLSTAERMVRLFRRMAKFPLVREAFLEGALSECQALLQNCPKCQTAKCGSQSRLSISSSSARSHPRTRPMAATSRQSPRSLST